MRHQTIGPRGGITVEEVSCYTCVCFPNCTLLNSTKDFGCGDWADENGRRVFWGPEEKGKDALPDRPITDCVGCGKCEDVLEPPPLPLVFPPKVDSITDAIIKLKTADPEAIVRARLAHVREEVEAERVAPPDTDETEDPNA